MSKLAVVLFNLGGPDRLESVQPFLFNLFNDPAIVQLPAPLRWIVAKLLAKRRTPAARRIYAEMGGKSPLLNLTNKQALALEGRLEGPGGVRVFVAMRYWHPMSDATVAAVKEFGPDEIVLLPLYPQYSTTTTGSSLKEWKRAAAAGGLEAPTYAVCCYPDGTGWVKAQADLVSEAIGKNRRKKGVRVLFSAHGLPKKIIEGGDPYAWQVERTAQAVMETLKPHGLDWVVCYQSRVGPLEWIGPSIRAELERAAGDGVGVVIVPIAFVSEHSETLVELDIEYRKLAETLNIGSYTRVPAVGTAAAFIENLAAMVEAARAEKRGGWAIEGSCTCPSEYQRCARNWKKT